MLTVVAIDLLFVDPHYSHRGIGRALVSQFCHMANERGLDGVIEASPEGRRTYELCGFVNKGPVTISIESWPGKPEHLYYWMERKATQLSNENT